MLNVKFAVRDLNKIETLIEADAVNDSELGVLTLRYLAAKKRSAAHFQVRQDRAKQNFNDAWDEAVKNNKLALKAAFADVNALADPLRDKQNARVAEINGAITDLEQKLKEKEKVIQARYDEGSKMLKSEQEFLYTSLRQLNNKLGEAAITFAAVPNVNPHGTIYGILNSSSPEALSQLNKMRDDALEAARKERDERRRELEAEANAEIELCRQGLANLPGTMLQTARDEVERLKAEHPVILQELRRRYRAKSERIAAEEAACDEVCLNAFVILKKALTGFLSVAEPPAPNAEDDNRVLTSSYHGYHIHE